MRKARYNLDELLAHLREKGIFDPANVEFAVLETSGKLSVIESPSTGQLHLRIWGSRHPTKGCLRCWLWMVT